jgi:hypothetical protein
MSNLVLSIPRVLSRSFINESITSSFACGYGENLAAGKRICPRCFIYQMLEYSNSACLTKHRLTFLVGVALNQTLANVAKLEMSRAKCPGVSSNLHC